MLLRVITSLDMGSFNEKCVKSRLSKIFDKNLSRDEVKALNNLVKNKHLAIQKADQGSFILILNRSDYISKLRKIWEETFKFEKVNIE